MTIKSAGKRTEQSRIAGAGCPISIATSTATPAAVAARKPAAVWSRTRWSSDSETRSTGAGRLGTGMNSGLKTWSAVMGALNHLAIAIACSMTCADASDKSTGHRMRLMFGVTSSPGTSGLSGGGTCLSQTFEARPSADSGGGS